jgi:alkylation response protein AidB-like acyl-CoA dehydrogenase
VSTFELTSDIKELVRVAARLGQEQLDDGGRRAEQAGAWPERVSAVLRQLPLGGLDLPESLGGVGAGCVAKVAVLEELSVHDAGGLPAHDQPGPAAGAVLACPDPARAREVAAASLSGTAGCALAVVEEEQPLPGRLAWLPARPPPAWVWVSQADDLRLLRVTVDGSGRQAADGAALAFHASGSGQVSLAGAELVGRWLLPPRAGLEIRGRARLWAAAVSLGVARAALASTLAYTTERVVFNRPVAHHQGNAFDLAAAAARVHAAGLCVRDAAARFDGRDPDAGFWATEAWVETTEAAVAVTDLGIQLLGGHGFLMDHVAEKRFREARMLGLLLGGRDGADADLASAVLEVVDPILPGERP